MESSAEHLQLNSPLVDYLTEITLSIEEQNYPHAFKRWQLVYSRCAQLPIDAIPTFLTLTQRLMALPLSSREDLYSKLLSHPTFWHARLPSAVLIDYYQHAASFYDQQPARNKVLGYWLKAYRLAEDSNAIEYQKKISQRLDLCEVEHALTPQIQRLEHAWQNLHKKEAPLHFEAVIAWLFHLQRIANTVAYAHTAHLLEKLYRDVAEQISISLRHVENQLHKQSESSQASLPQDRWCENSQAFEKVIATVQPVIEGFKRHRQWALGAKVYEIIIDKATRRLVQQGYDEKRWDAELVKIDQVKRHGNVSWPNYQSLWQHHR